MTSRTARTIRSARYSAVSQVAKATVRRYGSLKNVMTEGTDDDKRKVFEYVAQESNRLQRQTAGLK